LGLALARALAARGWQLIVDAREAGALHAAEAELSKRAKVIAVAGDVNEPAHRDVLAQVARTLGGLDALVNNASTLGPNPLPPLLQYPLEALAAVFHTNVIAPLALIQAVQHAHKPGACVINVSSAAAVAPCAGWVGYARSK